MKRLIFMSLLCIVYAKGFSQTTDPSTDNTGSFNVIRSTIGISGSSNTISTANGNYIISQSIGQSSIIGTGSNAGYTLRQGYQQPSILADAPSGNDNDKLEAKIYPNPFNHSIYISFSERITKEIKVLLFDIKGSLIYTQKFAPSQFVKLDLGDLANGNYILNVESKNKNFSTKLIKR